MSGNSFIGGLRDDRLDSLYATDEELAAGLNTKINTQTFTNQVNTLNTSIATKADQGAVDSAMALKANQSDVDAAVVLKANQIYVDNQLNTKANQSEVDSAMALKANQSEVDADMALKANQSEVDSAMALKANQSEVDSAMALKANQSDVDSAMALKANQSDVDSAMATKQDTGDFATNTALTDGLATKAPTGDYATNTALTDGLATKAPTGDYATNTALTDGLATKQATGNYALQEDIPSLAGGYSVGAVDNLLALKADKSELVYRETGEVDANGDLVLDANGNPVRDPTYTLNQNQLGAKLKAMDDTTNGKQNAGDYITRSEAQQGDASASIGGAIAGGLLGTASVVWSGVTSGGQTVTKTVGDVFKDIGDAFGDGDGGDAPPAINYNTFVTKPGDWLSTPGVFLPADDLSLYTARKAKNTPTLESDNLQIKSSSVFLKSGLLDTPRAGYKLDVGGSVYVDGELNAGSITCPDINGEVFKVQNDTDNSFFKAKHDGNLIRFTKHNNTIDVNQNIGTAEAPEYNTEQVVGNDIMNMNLVDGKVKIPGALQVLGSLTNATGASYALQSAVDSLNFTTIENVDNLIDARLQHSGLVDGDLQSLVYDKTEVDALIPDVSEYETTTQLDTRFSTYETTTQLDTRFTDFRTASDAVYQPIALPENPYVLQSVLDIGLAGYQPTPPDGDTFALTSALPDVSVFNTSTEVDTKITTSLNSYDTSTEVNNKISTGLNSYDTSTEVDSKVSTALTSYDTSLENDTKIAGALLNYNTSTEVDNKISTSLNSYDTSTEVDSKILNAGVAGYWSQDTNLHLKYDTDTNIKGHTTIFPNGGIFTKRHDTGAMFQAHCDELGDDQYSFVLNAPRPGTNTGGATHFINGSTRPGADLSQGSSKYVIRNDSGILQIGHPSHNTEVYSPKLRIIGGSWDTKFDLTREGTICRKYTDVNYVDHGSGLHFSGDVIYPTDGSGTLNNDVLNLGVPTNHRFKNIYASDSVYLNDYYEQAGSQYFGKRYGFAPYGCLSGMEIENTTLGGNYSQKLHLRSHYYGASHGRRLTVAENGNIGIGVETPNAPLEVQEVLSRSVGEGFREYGMFSQGGYSPDITTGITIDAWSGVVASTFYARSDERIKENIVDVNDNEALDLLRLLKPKTYEYKDKVQKGSKRVFGFIAQDIKSVLPECIATRVEGIPNILEVAKFDLLNKSNVITFTKFDTSNLVSNTSTLNVYGATGGLHKVNVLEVINNKSIKIDTDLSKFVGSFDDTDNLITETTTTTLSLEEYEVLEDKEGYVEEANTYIKTTITNVGNSILVHGEMVDDFLSVELDYLWTIATSALQQVDRELHAEKAKVASLEARLSALEEKI